MKKTRATSLDVVRNINRLQAIDVSTELALKTYGFGSGLAFTLTDT